MTKLTPERKRTGVITALVVTGFGIGGGIQNHKDRTRRHKGLLPFFVPSWLCVSY
jgi:hypothetical protein